uniref:Uncharacterized protein n=1 Tax=Anguilla anguilla TaxID=7936 RepID=A0A0E9XZ32_ANGAN
MLIRLMRNHWVSGQFFMGVMNF